jgi:hypothetical protein
MLMLYRMNSQEDAVAAWIVFSKEDLKTKIAGEKIDRSTHNGSQGLVSKNGILCATGDRGTQFSKLYSIYP